MFGGIYQNRRVLITGNTGFKGSILAWILHDLGADVQGYALSPNTEPNNFDLLELPYDTDIANVLDSFAMQNVFNEFAPEIVFHLAAQPLVRCSYEQPVATFSVNIQGTVNVLECCRLTPSVKAVAVITSDKCYRTGSPLPFTENSPLGGADPYSASKACAEIVAESYRHSFINHDKLLATCRAGNVIGGGDWAADRLMPDLMRNAADNKITLLRNPAAVRPWQHVFEPLTGYLMLGEKLLAQHESFARAWNFGPDSGDAWPVAKMAEYAAKFWPQIKFDFADAEFRRNQVAETDILRLDAQNAQQILQWRPVWTAAEAVQYTTQWYRDFYTAQQLNTAEDWQQYLLDAKKHHADWL